MNRICTVPPPLEFEPAIVGPLRPREAAVAAICCALLLMAALRFGEKALPLIVSGGLLSAAILFQLHRDRIPLLSLISVARMRTVRIAAPDATMVSNAGYLFSRPSSREAQLHAAIDTISEGVSSLISIPHGDSRALYFIGNTNIPFGVAKQAAIPIGEAEWVMKGGVASCDGACVAFVTIRSLPRELPEDWISGLLVRFPYSGVSVALSRMPEGTALAMLRRATVNMQAEIMVKAHAGKSTEDLQLQLEELSELHARLSSSSTRVYRCRILFTVHSTSVEQTFQLAQELIAHLRSCGAAAELETWLAPRRLREFCGARAVDLSAGLFVTEESLPALLPLVSSFGDETGTVMGMNAVTGEMLRIDRFNRLNHNMLIAGKSGSGKSFFAKLLLLREAEAGGSFFIIDPLGEFCAPVLMAGGICVNVFAEGLGLGMEEGISVELLSSAAQLISDETGMDMGMIRDALLALRNSGGTFREEISRNAVLSEAAAHERASYLFSGGPIPADARIICFDLSHRKEGFEHASRFLLHLSFELCQRRAGRKTILIDEAWHLMKEGLSEIKEVVRHSRHFETSVVIVTQNCSDVLSTGDEHLFNNCSLIALFRHDALDSSIISRLELEEEDLLFLGSSFPRAKRAAHFVLLDGEHKIPVICHSTELERLLCSTDAGCAEFIRWTNDMMMQAADNMEMVNWM